MSQLCTIFARESCKCGGQGAVSYREQSMWPRQLIVEEWRRKNKEKSKWKEAINANAPRLQAMYWTGSHQAIARGLLAA